MRSIFSQLFLALIASTHLANGQCERDPSETDADVWLNRNDEWDYYGCGPIAWPTAFSESCGAAFQSQSPINLVTGTATPITLTSYNNFFDLWQWQNHTSWTVSNDGHSLHLSAKDASAPVAVFTSPASDNYTYYLSGMHFHWGNISSEGSEHEFDGGLYPLEIHFVHYRSDFDDISAAIDDGMESNAAVVGFIYQLSEEDNSYLDKFLDNIESIVNYSASESMVINDLNINDMIVNDGNNNDYKEFFNYEGSLTVPPCSPIVRWQVLTDMLSVSAAQLDRFRLLMDWNDLPLHQNWRPVQENVNTVYYYTLGDSDGNDSDGDSNSSVRASVSIGSCSVCLAVFAGLLCLFL